jgi:hypothetical protein
MLQIRAQRFGDSFVGIDALGFLFSARIFWHEFCLNSSPAFISLAIASHFGETLPEVRLVHDVDGRVRNRAADLYIKVRS